MKRLFALLLIICTLTASVYLLCVGASAVSGSNEGCSWSLDGSVLTVKGNGTVSFGTDTSWRGRVEKLVIEEGPMAIGEDAFRDFTNLKEVVLPSSVKTIGMSAFRGCESLSSVNIPEGVVLIDLYAFNDCEKLLGISIPKTVTKMGTDFVGCPYLSYINVDKDNPVYTSMDGVLFSKDKTVLYKYPEGKADSANNYTYTVPDTVKTIEMYAFYYAFLDKLIIPDTVEFIELNALEGVWVGETTDGVVYIGNHAVEPADKDTLRNCTLKKGTKTIISGAFTSASNLKTLNIPEGFTVINDHAFSWCKSLETIFLPASLKYIGESAFYDCTSLKKIYYGGSESDFKKIDIGPYNDNIKNLSIQYNSCYRGAEHKWDETIEIAPTCIEAGRASRKCKVCEFQTVGEVEALGHANENWQQTKAPTCVESGTEESVCSVCSQIVTKRLDPLNHSFGDWSYAVMPTCTENGVEKRSCVLCNELEARYVDPVGHSFGEWFVAKEAGCETVGASQRLCSNCKEVEEQPIEASGHNYGEAVIITKPTTKKLGVEELTCQNCGNVLSREIPMLEKAELDVVPVIIVSVVCVLAVVIVIVFIVRSRKKNKE